MATEKQQDERESRREADRGQQEERGNEPQEQEASDLKEREYRDKEGNIHHHTRTSEEMKDRE